MEKINLTFPTIREKLGNSMAVSNPYNQIPKLAIENFYKGNDKNAMVHNQFYEEAKKEAYDKIKNIQMGKMKLLVPRKRLKPNPGGYKPFQTAVYCCEDKEKLQGGAVPYEYARKILNSRASQLKNIQNVKNGLPSDFSDSTQEIQDYDLPKNDHELQINEIRFSLSNLYGSLLGGELDSGYIFSEVQKIFNLLIKNIVYFDGADLEFIRDLRQKIIDIIHPDNGIIVSILSQPGGDEESKKVSIMVNLKSRLEFIYELLNKYLEKNIYNLQFSKRKLALKTLFKDLGLNDLVKNWSKVLRQTDERLAAQGGPPDDNTGDGDGGGGRQDPNVEIAPDLPPTGGPNPPPGGPPSGDFSRHSIYSDEPHPRAFDPSFPAWETLEEQDFTRLPFGAPFDSVAYAPSNRLPIGAEQDDSMEILGRVYDTWANEPEIFFESREAMEEAMARIPESRLRQEEINETRDRILTREEEIRRREMAPLTDSELARTRPDTAAAAALRLAQEEQQEPEPEPEREIPKKLTPKLFSNLDLPSEKIGRLMAQKKFIDLSEKEKKERVRNILQAEEDLMTDFKNKAAELVENEIEKLLEKPENRTRDRRYLENEAIGIVAKKYKVNYTPSKKTAEEIPFDRKIRNLITSIKNKRKKNM
jgi:hypothetical protein